MIYTQSNTLITNDSKMEEPTKHLTISHYNKQFGHLFKYVLNRYGNVNELTINKIEKIYLSDYDNDSIVITFKIKDIPLPVDKIILYPDELNENYKGSTIKLNQFLLLTSHKANKSLLKINTCLSPSTLADFLVLLVVPLPMVCYIYKPLLLWIPIIGSILYDNEPYLITIIILEILCHIIESVIFITPLLSYYSIPVDLQVEWYVWGLLEGYGPVRRLNAFAKPKELELIQKLSN